MEGYAIHILGKPGVPACVVIQCNVKGENKVNLYGMCGASSVRSYLRDLIAMIRSRQFEPEAMPSLEGMVSELETKLAELAALEPVEASEPCITPIAA